MGINKLIKITTFNKITNTQTQNFLPILYPKTNKILVSVSGGPDSLALASMCKALHSDCKKKFPFEILSLSKKNVIRGLHLQIKKPQGKFITVMQGKIFDVVVDCRKNLRASS